MARPVVGYRKGADSYCEECAPLARKVLDQGRLPNGWRRLFGVRVHQKTLCADCGYPLCGQARADAMRADMDTAPIAKPRGHGRGWASLWKCVRCTNDKRLKKNAASPDCPECGGALWVKEGTIANAE
jgi:DNA-directed RNA polymerase subunit RPC12/RpoP